MSITIDRIYFWKRYNYDNQTHFDAEHNVRWIIAQPNRLRLTLQWEMDTKDRQRENICVSKNVN